MSAAPHRTGLGTSLLALVASWLIQGCIAAPCERPLSAEGSFETLASELLRGTGSLADLAAHELSPKSRGPSGLVYGEPLFGRWVFVWMSVLATEDLGSFRIDVFDEGELRATLVPVLPARGGYLALAAWCSATGYLGWGQKTLWREAEAGSSLPELPEARYAEVEIVQKWFRGVDGMLFHPACFFPGAIEGTVVAVHGNVLVVASEAPIHPRKELGVYFHLVRGARYLGMARSYATFDGHYLCEVVDPPEGGHHVRVGTRALTRL